MLIPILQKMFIIAVSHLNQTFRVIRILWLTPHHFIHHRNISRWERAESRFTHWTTRMHFWILSDQHQTIVFSRLGCPPLNGLIYFFPFTSDLCHFSLINTTWFPFPKGPEAFGGLGYKGQIICLVLYMLWPFLQLQCDFKQ